MAQPLALRMAVALGLCLAFSGTAVAQVLVPGGKTAVPIGDIPPLEETDDQGQKHTYYWLFAENSTGRAIKDFELELKSCKSQAKFKRIKVFPRFGLGEDGAMDPSKTDEHADWDVDDNMDGKTNTSGGFAPDPNSTRPENTTPPTSNETDNVDDSPDIRARVDANGTADPVLCCGAASPGGDAQARGTESGGETGPGDPGQGGGEYLDGKGGVQPGGTFALKIEFTAPPAGEKCEMAVQPSGGGGKLIAAADPGAKPGLQPGQDYGYGPGACPPGQSGGLLAGSLNTLFGADLAGGCEDNGDRDRHNGARGGKDKETE